MGEASAGGIQETLDDIWEKYRVPIVLILISLALVVTAGVLLVKSSQTASEITFSSDTSEASISGKTIYVDIQGAVTAPGVYALPLGSRVYDGISAAGGLIPSADSTLISRSVNRAEKLTDGAKLYFPEKGNVQSAQTSGATSVGIVTTDAGVSINSASASQLEALSGIGPKTSAKIIDNRPYGSVEELLTKKVLFQSTFDKLKDQLTL